MSWWIAEAESLNIGLSRKVEFNEALQVDGIKGFDVDDDDLSYGFGS